MSEASRIDGGGAVGGRRAVLLAGGRGTRLRPYTITLPKPLVPVGERPILESVLRQLGEAGFGRATLAVNHQAEIIRAYFGDGERFGIEIDYSLETRPLGTMGPLRIIPDLPEHFLVMNGDVLTDLDLDEFFDAHQRSGSPFTIAATSRRQRIDYGVLEVDEGSVLRRIDEKPEVPYLVSMGIYAVSREVIACIPTDRAYGFDELMHDLIARGDEVQVHRHEGYWLDIGRPDDYEQAVRDHERGAIPCVKQGALEARPAP